MLKFKENFIINTIISLNNYYYYKYKIYKNIYMKYIIYVLYKSVIVE